MGRLTLNVLLSFAQFERGSPPSVSATRSRPPSGGVVPLGYETKDRKITVNEAEAERVRTIFRSYLPLGSFPR